MLNCKKNQYNNRNPHENRNTYLEKDRNYINRPVRRDSDSLERERNQVNRDSIGFGRERNQRLPPDMIKTIVRHLHLLGIAPHVSGTNDFLLI